MPSKSFVQINYYTEPASCASVSLRVAHQWACKLQVCELVSFEFASYESVTCQSHSFRVLNCEPSNVRVVSCDSTSVWVVSYESISLRSASHGSLQIVSSLQIRQIKTINVRRVGGSVVSNLCSEVSEEFKKYTPTSLAALWFVNGRDRKPR